MVNLNTSIEHLWIRTMTDGVNEYKVAKNKNAV